MADLESIGGKSIDEMSTDEAIEYLRTIRLNRRTQVKTHKETKKAKQSKQPPEKKLTKEQLSALLDFVKSVEGID